MAVEIGEEFGKDLKKGREAVRQAVAAFVVHLGEHGFVNLRGRNKPSWIIRRDDPKRDEKIAAAKRLHLYHYHIGPKYNASHDGDTSEHVLHYQLLTMDDGEILVRIVDMSRHPPFKLPDQKHLD